MKKVAVLALPLLMLNIGTAKAENDAYLHLGASTAIGSIAHQYFTPDKKELAFQTSSEKRMAMIKSTSLCAGVGLGKELYDNATGGEISEKDLAFDALGCMIGTAVSATFNNLYVNTKFDFDDDGDVVTMVNFNYNF